jgi:hypothetical protein
MMRLFSGALLVAIVAAGALACVPRETGTAAPQTTSSSPPPSGSAPSSSGPSALDTERVREAERALGMIGRSDPALAARIAASELAHPVHGLPPRIRETLNALAGEELNASQRSLLIRTTFEEDAQLRAAFDATCPPGWSALALASLAEGQRPEVIANACKAHPAAQLGPTPPPISLAIPLTIGVEGVLRAQGALALEIRIARSLMHLQ